MLIMRCPRFQLAVLMIPRQAGQLAATVGPGDQRTRLALGDFESYMRKTGKFVRTPAKDLDFRYNTRTKDLEVLYRNKWVRLTQASDHTKFYAPSNYANELQVRLGLREPGQPKPSRIPVEQRRQLTEIRDNASKNSDDIEMVQVANDTDTAIKNLFQSVGTNTDGLPMREFAGFDKSIQRLRGAIVDTQAKIVELENHIARDVEKRNTPGIDEATIEIIDRRLQSNRDQLAGQREVLATLRGELRGNFTSIRETVDYVLNSDTTLAERIRTLFREQGVTIASLITALGFIISTIVLSITNALGVTSKPTPKPDPKPEPPKPDPPKPEPPKPEPSGAKEWFKKQLQKLGEWLKALAGKAAAALPDIIGAAVSWLLKTAGGVVAWLAEHLWTLAVALVVAVGVWIKERRS